MREILVIREFDEFSRILAEAGFRVINLPLIETRPLADLSAFEARLEKLADYDGIFLTSKNSARIVAEKLRAKNIRFGGKVYVLGTRGFEILKREKLDLVFFEQANTAREMLAKIASEDLRDRRFLFVRGERSLRTIPEFLAKIATVDEAIVYETRTLAPEIDKIEAIREKLGKKEIAAACFFSPSGAESFLEQFGAPVLHQTLIATIGTTTAEFLERRNLKVEFIAAKATAEDFAAGLVDFLEKNCPQMNADKHG